MIPCFGCKINYDDIMNNDLNKRWSSVNCNQDISFKNTNEENGSIDNIIKCNSDDYASLTSELTVARDSSDAASATSDNSKSARDSTDVASATSDNSKSAVQTKSELDNSVGNGLNMYGEESADYGGKNIHTKKNKSRNLNKRKTNKRKNKSRKNKSRKNK
jgi:hypothetical protein